jgi:hypothetical protein
LQPQRFCFKENVFLKDFEKIASGINKDELEEVEKNENKK